MLRHKFRESRVGSSSVEEHALTEQIGIDSSIHLAFEHRYSYVESRRGRDADVRAAFRVPELGHQC